MEWRLIRYVAVRIGEALLVVLGVVSIVFFISRFLGNPAVLLLPPGSSAKEIARFRHELGLDRPLLIQYLTFLMNVLHGRFGTSITQHRPALQVILERLPATLELASASLVLGCLLGAVLGVFAASCRHGLTASLLMLPALLGQAVPVFWLGLVLIQMFAVSLRWLPAAGIGGVGHLVLPATTLAAFTMATVARMLRASMEEVLGEEYVRTAVAKGLPTHVVVLGHVVPNALLPAITLVGVLTGELFGGAIVTETVFSWPGVGRAMVQAIEMNDFPVVQAGVIVVGVIFVFVNLFTDLLYIAIDPRIRLTL